MRRTVSSDEMTMEWEGEMEEEEDEEAEESREEAREDAVEEASIMRRILAVASSKQRTRSFHAEESASRNILSHFFLGFPDPGGRVRIA